MIIEEITTMRTTLNLLTLIAVAAAASFAADANAGKAVYDKSCKTCHGADGTPNANIAKMMKVDMKALGSPEVQAQSDADIKGIIANGKGKMPKQAAAAGSADDVVAYLRTLKK
jgi:mono/diheme cytochrome c family protein